MPGVSIYESEVSCLSTVVSLYRKCQNQKLKLSSDTQQYLLYLTLKEVGPAIAQKAVSKLVAKGDLKWNEDEDFEVEQILDCNEENGTKFYLIKWKGWSHAHNSWEPKANLECEDLMTEFHIRNPGDSKPITKTGVKRKFEELRSTEHRTSKKSRIDELFTKLKSYKEIITPSRLMELTSPDKVKKKLNGVLGCEGLRAPKYNNTGITLNKRTKAFKMRQKEIQKALKDWENHLNSVSTDPASITVENVEDLEGPPANFVYINDYKPGEGIEIPKDPLVGCECTDCVSSKGKCCAAQFGVEYAYYSRKRLRIPVGRPIYECNKRCLCGPECSNRVVQQGRKHKVCIFRTKGRGWGVKALEKIRSGTFVMEYVGEVISNEEAEIRGQTYDSVGQTYLLDLDFTEGDCQFTVDAAVYGNVSHFVNHSCDPNLEIFNVWINTLDPRLPRVALFSRRDVEKGEELTFDYKSSIENAVIKAGNGIETGLPSSKTGEDTSEIDLASEKTMEDTSDIDYASEKLMEDASDIDNASEKTLEDTSDIDNASEKTMEDTSEIDNASEKTMEDKASDSESTTVVTEQKQKYLYRMVCQCGAKNCRKYVF